MNKISFLCAASEVRTHVVNLSVTVFETVASHPVCAIAAQRKENGSDDGIRTHTLQILSLLPAAELGYVAIMVRVEGIEPSVHRLKVYCHATWLHPHVL